MKEFIEKVLAKADFAPRDKVAFVAADTTDGMVVKIWYRTYGYDNVLVRYEVVTLEQWEWERHGCTNNEEWHRYLNSQLWAPYRAGLKES